MLDKIAKVLITLIIGIAIGYAWRISHEVSHIEEGKQAVMSEMLKATVDGIPFMVCLQDDKCLRFIPRADSKSKFIVQVRER